MGFSSIKKTIINVDGKTYASADELPPEFRALLADRDGDGVFDIVQGGSGTETTWNINGVIYHGLDEMPSDIRTIAERMQEIGAGPGAANIVHSSSRTFEQEPRDRGNAMGIPTPLAMAIGAALMAMAFGVWLWMKG